MVYLLASVQPCSQAMWFFADSMIMWSNFKNHCHQHPLSSSDSVKLLVYVASVHNYRAQFQIQLRTYIKEQINSCSASPLSAESSNVFMVIRFIKCVVLHSKSPRCGGTSPRAVAGRHPVAYIVWQCKQQPYIYMYTLILFQATHTASRRQQSHQLWRSMDLVSLCRALKKCGLKSQIPSGNLPACCVYVFGHRTL